MQYAFLPRFYIGTGGVWSVQCTNQVQALYLDWNRWSVECVMYISSSGVVFRLAQVECGVCNVHIKFRSCI